MPSPARRASLPACAAAVAGSLAIAVLAASPSQAAKAGTVEMVVRTPAGVNANVLMDGPSRQVFAKSVGAKLVDTRSVKPGDYTVRAPSVISDGVLYGATVRRSAEVEPGRTTRVTVVYDALGGASGLRATDVSAGSAELVWAPGDSTAVRLRRTPGNTPAHGVGDGVPVATDGAGATDSALQAGRSYTYALFSKVDGAWLGPLALKVKTPTDARPVAVAMPRSSTVLRQRDTRRVTVEGADILVQVPAGGRVPVVGSGVSLVPSTDIRGGFVGRVTSVLPDGSAYRATPGGLADVVDYLDADLDLDRVGEVPLTPVAPSRARAAVARKLLGPRFSGRAFSPDTCQSLSPDNVIDSWDGSLETSGHLVTSLRRVGSAAPTATYDFGLSLAGDISVDVNSAVETPGGSVACSTTFRPVYVTLLARPVPVVLAVEPLMEVHATDGTKIAALRAQGTGTFSAVGGWGEGGAQDAQRTVTGTVSAGEVTRTGNVWTVLGANFTLGSFLDSARDASPVAVSGAVIPAASFGSPYFSSEGDPRRDSCLSLSGFGQTLFSLDAGAWLGADTEELGAWLPYDSTNYGGSTKFPSGCENTLE